jgi:hypothetical protein
MKRWRKIPIFNANSKGHTHPCSRSTDLKGSGKFTGGSENCCRNPTSEKFFGGSGFLKFKPIKLLESGWLSAIKDWWRYACIESRWSLEEECWLDWLAKSVWPVCQTGLTGSGPVQSDLVLDFKISSRIPYIYIYILNFCLASYTHYLGDSKYFWHNFNICKLFFSCA